MVSDLSVKRAAKDELYLDRLPSATRRAFLHCSEHFTFLNRSAWYLAGGTTLALQVGHRQSHDLDFFVPKLSFRVTEFERRLLATRGWVTSHRQQGTLFGTFHGAKMSFIAYPFFKPTKKRLRYGHVSMLLPEDIATMKIVAISQRGRKRDFIDLYWYCTHREPLEDIVQRALTQFPGQEHNLPHILKSLAYFDDANADVMPELFFKANWKTVKGYFQKEVPTLARKLLKLR